MSSGWWVIAVLYRIKKEGYLLRSRLVGARRTLLFMVEQVFLRMGPCGQCIVQIHGAQCGERGGQRAEKTFYVNIFLDLP